MPGRSGKSPRGASSRTPQAGATCRQGCPISVDRGDGHHSCPRRHSPRRLRSCAKRRSPDPRPRQEKDCPDARSVRRLRLWPPLLAQYGLALPLCVVPLHRLPRGRGDADRTRPRGLHGLRQGLGVLDRAARVSCPLHRRDPRGLRGLRHSTQLHVHPLAGGAVYPCRNADGPFPVPARGAHPLGGAPAGHHSHGGSAKIRRARPFRPPVAEATALNAKGPPSSRPRVVPPTARLEHQRRDRTPAPIAIQTCSWARTISTLVTAFAADPFIRWVFPRVDQHLLTFPRVLKFFAGTAIDSDTAYRPADFCSAALWLPPGVSPDKERLGQVLVDHVDAAMQERVFAIMEQVRAGHSAATHWYLPAMGVHPIRQGSGIGSTVLDHSLVSCEQTCRLAYLESTNPANIPFNLRHGFEVVGEIQIDGSPVHKRMLREVSFGTRNKRTDTSKPRSTLTSDSAAQTPPSSAYSTCRAIPSPRYPTHRDFLPTRSAA